MCADVVFVVTHPHHTRDRVCPRPVFVIHAGRQSRCDVQFAPLPLPAYPVVCKFLVCKLPIAGLQVCRSAEDHPWHEVLQYLIFRLVFDALIDSLIKALSFSRRNRQRKAQV